MSRWCVVLAVAMAPALAAAQPSLDSVRVAVVREDPQVSLEIVGHFRVTTLPAGRSIHQASQLPEVAVRATPQGIALGEALLPFSQVHIEPEREAAIRLNGTRLRGAVEIVRQKNQTLLVVNHVDLEDYLRGVLSKEAPHYWPQEALKAIAIAARTYTLYQRVTKTSVPYDVTGDVMSQDYGGRSAEKTSTTRAVKATEGWILLFQDRLFPPFYHSTCGGVTENGRVMGKFNFLPLRGGVACTFCSASPFFRWQRRLTKADVAWAMRKSAHGAVGEVRELRIMKRSGSGRVEAVAVVGAQRTVTLSGYDVRALFGFERIRSPWFTVTLQDDAFILEGRGWGHGVGMCQWGAAELARRGFSAAEILAYYYPGTRLVHVSSFAGRPVAVIEEGA